MYYTYFGRPAGSGMRGRYQFKRFQATWLRSGKASPDGRALHPPQAARCRWLQPPSVAVQCHNPQMSNPIALPSELWVKRAF